MSGIETEKANNVQSRPHWTRSWIAIVATAFLVLQAALAGFAGGANAAPLALDAFGNPLCIGNSVGDPDENGAGGHQLPNCCLASCSMFAPAMATVAHAAALRPGLVGEVAVATYHPVLSPTRGRGEPGRPRAPPLSG
ncbi:MAG: hypothetical protein RIB82_18405 [Sneathiellaceae bacterium]